MEYNYRNEVKDIISEISDEIIESCVLFDSSFLKELSKKQLKKFNEICDKFLWNDIYREFEERIHEEVTKSVEDFVKKHIKEISDTILGEFR